MASRRGGRSTGTTAVGAKAPTAAASPAASAFLDQTAVDLDDGMAAIADDGSDMMVRGDAGDVLAVSHATGLGEDEDGLVEETGSAFAWSVPDATPRLRRAALEFETTTSTQAYVPGIDIVATEAPATVLRPMAGVPTATGEPETRVVAIRKHRSGETIARERAPEIATQVAGESDPTEPEFMRPRMGADAADRDRESFSGRRPFDGVDPLTQRLGCRWFVDAARFDWCREGKWNLNPIGELDSRPRYVFTRWYQMDRIIVDVFRGDSDRVRREISEKIDCIRAQATIEGRPIGYLPCVRGAFVSDEVIARVKRGEIVPFQLAPLRDGVAV